ncbi:MAG: protein kinase domain-containing protein [Cyclonatronaceae bacterium]
MTKQRWEQIISVVDRALDLDSAGQLPFVEAECKHDRALRDEVVNFLSSIGPSELFWDDMLESSEALVNELASSATTADEFSPPTYLKQAGPYKVIELIARGGMGNVYLAERSDGQFKRKAAVKILRRELTSKHHVNMFYEEREILSSLEHPNIARLYDGGIADGRPYLVMEYVEGEPVSSYCSKESCTFENRMDLFRQMCDAVKYAHRNLVVHRDLKPDNILVTRDGTVKILDFGIAKVLDTELTHGNTAKEDDGHRLFSIHYAAPEQMTGGRITTSTDVYALGLLLYEMLTGKRPFDLTGKKRSEAEQIICTETPPGAGSNDPDAFFSGKRKSDLDAIIGKVLQKAPEDRYASVDQLIDDVQRYRAGLPVSALPGTWWYRFRRFIGRHPEMVVAVVVAVLAAGVYLVTLNLHAARLNDQRAIAEAERDVAEFARQRAEKEAARAEAITNLLFDAFEQADPAGKLGADVKMRHILDAGADRALTDLRDQPGLQADLLFTMAEVYRRINVRTRARPLAEQALAIRENMVVHDSGDIFESRLQLARILGGGRAIQENMEQALAIYKDLLPEAELRYGHDNLRFGQFLVAYANAYDWDLHGDQKLEMFDKGIALLRHSKGPDYQLALAQALTESAGFEGHRHLSNDGALERLNEALQIRLALHGRNHGSVATTMSNMALRLETIDPLAADTLMSQAVEIHRAWAGDSHTTTITLINNYAGILRERGELERAVPYYREALRLRQLHQPDERGANAYSHFGLGVVLIDLGRPAEAISHLEFVAETFGEDDFRGQRARAQLQRAHDMLR